MMNQLDLVDVEMTQSFLNVQLFLYVENNIENCSENGSENMQKQCQENYA